MASPVREAPTLPRHLENEHIKYEKYYNLLKRRGKEVELEKGSRSIYYHLRRMDTELTRSSKRNDGQS